MKRIFDKSRRAGIVKIAQTFGIFAVSGFIWSAYISKAKASLLTLLPPGARNKDDFLKNCIRCGMCVEACPYYTLKLAVANSNIFKDDRANSVPIGTPYFIPREVPCYMCEDIPCVKACPSDALSRELLENNGVLDINKARMGVAIVDTKNCIAYEGIQCDACYRACPLIDKAIYLEYKRNDRTGKHSFLLPIVVNDICTGCGKCERACVTKIASITILPRDVVLGKTGTDYIRGWDKQDEERLKNTPANMKSLPKSNAIDYLNN